MARNIFKVLGYSGVYEILNQLHDGGKTFSHIMRKTEINPGVLNRNLILLIEYRLIEKEFDKYKLTNIGIKALNFAISYNDDYINAVKKKTALKEYCKASYQRNKSKILKDREICRDLRRRQVNEWKLKLESEKCAV